MIYTSQEAFKCLIAELHQRTLRHSIHEFSSGAKMIDIWHKDLFYVVQIENEFAGISLVDDDNPGFELRPDSEFSTIEEFLSKLRDILNA